MLLSGDDLRLARVPDGCEYKSICRFELDACAVLAAVGRGASQRCVDAFPCQVGRVFLVPLLDCTEDRWVLCHAAQIARAARVSPTPARLQNVRARSGSYAREAAMYLPGE